MEKREILLACSLLLTCTLSACYGQTCAKVDTCKCQMTDGTGTINLKSLATPADLNAPRFSILGDDNFYYNYNPCIGFSSSKFQDLAIQQIGSANPNNEFNLGIQSTETFVHSVSSGTYVKYEDKPSNPKRNSSVLLICDQDAEDHTFEFVGELIKTDYEFLLIGPCSCPDACDDDGIIVSTTTTSTTTKTTTILSTSTTRTTTTTILSTNSPEAPFKETDQTSFWDGVGADIVSLIFHDLILVVVIGCIIAIVKFALGYSIACVRDEIPSMKFTNLHMDKSSCA